MGLCFAKRYRGIEEDERFALLGHVGIAGLGKSKRMMEDEFAERDIKPLTSQSIQEVVPGEIRLKDGSKVPFKLAMIAPPFKGVPAVAPLGNPRGFIPVDKNYLRRRSDYGHNSS